MHNYSWLFNRTYLSMNDVSASSIWRRTCKAVRDPNRPIKFLNLTVSLWVSLFWPENCWADFVESRLVAWESLYSVVSRSCVCERRLCATAPIRRQMPILRMDEWKNSVDGCVRLAGRGVGRGRVAGIRVVQGFGVDWGAGHTVLIRMLFSASSGTRGSNPQVESVMHKKEERSDTCEDC